MFAISIYYRNDNHIYLSRCQNTLPEKAPSSTPVYDYVKEINEIITTTLEMEKLRNRKISRLSQRLMTNQNEFTAH